MFTTQILERAWSIARFEADKHNAGTGVVMAAHADRRFVPRVAPVSSRDFFGSALVKAYQPVAPVDHGEIDFEMRGF